MGDARCCATLLPPPPRLVCRPRATAGWLWLLPGARSSPAKPVWHTPLPPLLPPPLPPSFPPSSSCLSSPLPTPPQPPLLLSRGPLLLGRPPPTAAVRAEKQLVNGVEASCYRDEQKKDASFKCLSCKRAHMHTLMYTCI